MKNTNTYHKVCINCLNQECSTIVSENLGYWLDKSSCSKCDREELNCFSSKDPSRLQICGVYIQTQLDNIGCGDGCSLDIQNTP